MTDTSGFGWGVVQLSGEGYLEDKGMNVSHRLENSLQHQFLDMDFFGSKTVINLPLSSSKTAIVLKIWVTNIRGIQCKFSIVFIKK